MKYKGKKNSLLVLIIAVVFIILMIIIALIMAGLEESDNVDNYETKTTVYSEEEKNEITSEITTKETVAIETTTVETKKQEPQTLNITNCEDLAKLLQTNSASEIKGFVEKYKGKTIEFDGNIAYINNHDNYKTRYDILIYSGDYNENGSPGPNFQFYYVNTYDLGIKDLYLPDFINTGNNIHIVAIVKEYDEVSDILKLDPVLIQSR